jgi:hypothetical protein
MARTDETLSPLAERLLSRSGSGPRIGAGSRLFDRLGLQNPYEASAPVGDRTLAEERFSFLSSEAYFAELRGLTALRGKLLGRIGRVRGAIRAHERFDRSVATASVRALRLGTPDVLEPVLVDWSTQLDAPHEEASDLASPQKAGGRRQSAAERALRGEIASASKVLEQLERLASLSRDGASRRVRDQIASLSTLEPVAQAEAAQRVARQLRGVSGVAMRQTDLARTGRGTEAHGERPLSVAQRRQDDRDSRGLRRVLDRSPVVMEVERRSESAVAGQATRRASRNAPVSVESAPPVRAARVAEEARSQGSVGRAGPPTAGSSIEVDPPAWRSRSTPRPTARVARAAVQAPDAPLFDTRRGLAASPAHAVDVPVARAAAAAPAARAARRMDAGVLTADGKVFPGPTWARAEVDGRVSGSNGATTDSAGVDAAIRRPAGVLPADALALAESAPFTADAELDAQAAVRRPRREGGSRLEALPPMARAVSRQVPVADRSIVPSLAAEPLVGERRDARPVVRTLGELIARSPSTSLATTDRPSRDALFDDAMVFATGDTASEAVSYASTPPAAAPSAATRATPRTRRSTTSSALATVARDAERSGAARPVVRAASRALAQERAGVRGRMLAPSATAHVDVDHAERVLRPSTVIASPSGRAWAEPSVGAPRSAASEEDVQDRRLVDRLQTREEQGVRAEGVPTTSDASGVRERAAAVRERTAEPLAVEELVFAGAVSDDGDAVDEQGRVRRTSPTSTPRVRADVRPSNRVQQVVDSGRLASTSRAVARAVQRERTGETGALLSPRTITPFRQERSAGERLGGLSRRATSAQAPARPTSMSTSAPDPAPFDASRSRSADEPRATRGRAVPEPVFVDGATSLDAPEEARDPAGERSRAVADRVARRIDTRDEPSRLASRVPVASAEAGRAASDERLRAAGSPRTGDTRSRAVPTELTLARANAGEASVEATGMASRASRRGRTAAPIARRSVTEPVTPELQRVVAQRAVRTALERSEAVRTVDPADDVEIAARASVADRVPVAERSADPNRHDAAAATDALRRTQDRTSEVGSTVHALSRQTPETTLVGARTVDTPTSEVEGASRSVTPRSRLEQTAALRGPRTFATPARVVRTPSSSDPASIAWRTRQSDTAGATTARGDVARTHEPAIVAAARRQDPATASPTSASVLSDSVLLDAVFDRSVETPMVESGLGRAARRMGRSREQIGSMPAMGPADLVLARELEAPRPRGLEAPGARGLEAPRARGPEAPGARGLEATADVADALHEPHARVPATAHALGRTTVRRDAASTLSRPVQSAQTARATMQLVNQPGLTDDGVLVSGGEAVVHESIAGGRRAPRRRPTVSTRSRLAEALDVSTRLARSGVDATSFALPTPGAAPEAVGRTPASPLLARLEVAADGTLLGASITSEQDEIQRQTVAGRVQARQDASQVAGHARPRTERLADDRFVGLAPEERPVDAPNAPNAPNARRADLPASRGIASTLDALVRPETRGTTEAGAQPLLRRRAWNRRSMAVDLGVQTPTLAGADFVPEDQRLDDAPAWARRAGRGTSAMAPAMLKGERPEREANGLMGALARAERPDEVVKVIFDRRTEIREVRGELPQEAVRLMQRISELSGPEADVLRRGGRVLPSAPQQSTLQGARSLKGSGDLTQLSAGKDGLGATRIMKLADKLMGLIHLAENNRQKEAQDQVRMAQDSLEARAEGGAKFPGLSVEDHDMNIEQLQKTVLRSVMEHFEELEQRIPGEIDGKQWF